jgi:hypothetical protein
MIKHNQHKEPQTLVVHWHNYKLHNAYSLGETIVDLMTTFQYI